MVWLFSSMFINLLFDSQILLKPLLSQADVTDSEYIPKQTGEENLRMCKIIDLLTHKR